MLLVYVFWGEKVLLKSQTQRDWYMIESVGNSSKLC